MHYMTTTTTTFGLLASTAYAFRYSALDKQLPLCINDIAQGLLPTEPQVSLSLSTLERDSIDSQISESWIQLPHTAPWAVPPTCAPNQRGKKPFCVFTSHSFAAGRGISLVTTPSVAAAVLDLPAFDEPESLRNINKEHAIQPYEQQDIPGKGVGLLANKTLYRGDRIFAHTPVLLLHAGIYNKTKLAQKDRQRMAKLAVDQLPKGRMDLFYNLMGHFGGNPIDDRVDTNTFEVELAGVSHYAVFPETSRINHDCRPNSIYFFDTDTLTHYVHAMETIHPGTELSITYTDPRQSQAHRLGSLHTSWGFHCGCSLCTQDRIFTKESDSRLAQMEKLVEQLDDWSPDGEVDPFASELLISLFEQERLWVGRAEAYRLAAKAWNAVGEKWKAVKYARLAIELGTLDDGPKDKDTLSMKQLAEDPEGHWSWMRRARRSRNWIYNGY